MPSIEERLARLEKQKEPFVSKHEHVPFDPSSQLSVPASVMRDMVNAVPDRVVRDIVKTASVSVYLPQNPSVSPGTNKPNFTAERSMEVPGVEHCDRIADHFAALDKRELQRRK